MTHQSVFQLEVLFLRSAHDVGVGSHFRRVFQNGAEFQHFAFAVTHFLAHTQIVGSANQILESAQAQFAHVLADVLGQ